MGQREHGPKTQHAAAGNHKAEDILHSLLSKFRTCNYTDDGLPLVPHNNDGDRSRTHARHETQTYASFLSASWSSLKPASLALEICRGPNLATILPHHHTLNLDRKTHHQLGATWARTRIAITRCRAALYVGRRTPSWRFCCHSHLSRNDSTTMFEFDTLSIPLEIAPKSPVHHRLQNSSSAQKVSFPRHSKHAP